jgi:Tol biopolymer transport system component
MTSGPTEEEGIALAPDGKSLITSLGVRQREVWIHDSTGDRQISTEGFPSMPKVSANGKRVYYLLRQSSASPLNELHSFDLESGKVEKVLPGFAISDYEVSRDDQEVAFTTRTEGESEIWLAPLDRRTPPRKITQGGDHVSFGTAMSLLGRPVLERTRGKRLSLPSPRGRPFRTSRPADSAIE